MRLQDAVFYVESCRDSHEEAADPDTFDASEIAADPAFHAQTIREYDEVLEALRLAFELIHVIAYDDFTASRWLRDSARNVLEGRDFQ